MNTNRSTFVETAIAAVMAASLALLPEVVRGTTSQSVVIERNPEKSFLWHTSPTGAFELRWAKPQGATSATLSVTGAGYSHEYENLTGDSLFLSLPPATTSRGENVYQLVLTFDDSTVLRATLGSVSTLGASSATAMALRESVRTWRRSGVYPVLPIPFGVERFEVDGVATDTGLGGDAGWFYFKPAGEGVHTLRAEMPDGAVEAELATPDGMILIAQ